MTNVLGHEGTSDENPLSHTPTKLPSQMEKPGTQGNDDTCPASNTTTEDQRAVIHIRYTYRGDNIVTIQIIAIDVVAKPTITTARVVTVYLILFKKLFSLVLLVVVVVSFRGGVWADGIVVVIRIHERERHFKTKC
ncbi:Hypothetical predicted protein [Octopus vulgaris]|uniref:Uncharacterized protein n=1 Tax=Octopus vulgaris TaxID=6645 RepID=A0AA36BSL1_OCTVU|nr:Hypothetical predicted protein [Octopus vulgaris]